MEQSERKALGGAVPVATLGQGDGPQAQSPRRGRKRDPVATSSEARDGKPVQLALFDLLGPVMPAKLTAHPLYSVWQAMVTRCHCPSSTGFCKYGQRGIVVCDEWRNSSRAFIAWALLNGWQPGLQLDRRDNDGPYSPGNCRFITRRVNNLNRRDTVRLSNGRPAWPQAQRNGVSRSAFDCRVHRGWTPDQAAGIAPPPQRRQKAAGLAQPALDVRRGRATDKPASQPAPGRSGATKQKRGTQDV